MDRVVCVSHGQAAKVLRTGVPPARARVIPNAVHAERFASPDPADRQRLGAFFPATPGRVVGAAGRLSPDKGFGLLIEAAAVVAREDPSVGFVLFGDGPLRPKLERQAEDAGLSGRFIFAGFRDDVDRFMPFLDLLVLPSFTEGMPNVVLEAFAAGVPVVATAVGGTPEVVEDGRSGFLVPPGDAAALAEGIRASLATEDGRRELGRRGRERVRREFTFAAQARAYEELFEELGVGPARRTA
jgi:glycosyltransferase involved in cell wall biosynthesis